MDLSQVQLRTVRASLNTKNIIIIENHGLNSRTGFWWLHFSFDHGLEKAMEVRLTNFKYPGRDDLSLEIVKCRYLGIESEDQMASFDVVDALVNETELRRIVDSAASTESLLRYLEANVVHIVTRKIKYTQYRPQFRFFLSHKSKDKVFMRTFKDGLKFLGYETWLDEDDMPVGSNLQAALKTSIDDCHCLIAWLNDDYIAGAGDYCRAELLYAKQQGKIILPFGVHCEVSKHFTGDFAFLNNLLCYDPTTSTFFEILRRIDEALFNFEKLAI